MDGGAGVTAYDIVVLSLFAILIGRGIWLGFIKQITGLLALYLGYIVASRYHDKFFPFLRDLSDNPEIVFLASYVILFIVTYIIILLFGKLLAHTIQVSIVGWFDRILGAVLGFGKALIIVVLMHMVLGAVLSPESKMTRDCQSCDTLNAASEVTRDLISSKEVREALKRREPAITLDAVKGYLKPISSTLFNSGGETAKGKAEAGEKAAANTEK
ncbi:MULTISPECIES: CvpA family protein [Desulfosediminicola]|uniref:CvpA family protein n=1 Tax=Desulfosediminicola TaxID=2886823 RepID=UPI0010AC4EE8|nr:CvpA family protein [Desulfosediminicola ganghwensis]